MIRTEIQLILLTCVLACTPAAKAVSFGDPELQACVEADLGVSNPSSEQMQELISFSCNGHGLSDLSGLGYAYNLEDLSLYVNRIDDIGELGSLDSLRILDISRNDIDDLYPLARLTTLEALDADQNLLTDLSPLSGLYQLYYLDLDTNSDLSDLSPLAGLSNLQDFSCRETSVSDLSPLSGLTLLSKVQLQSNGLSDLSPLAHLENLDRIWLNYNDISDLTPLSGLNQLSILHIRGNRIRDLSPLTSLTNLSYLAVNANPLSANTLKNDIPKILANNPGMTLRYDIPDPSSTYTLSLSSTDGGTIVTPGEGTFDYQPDETVSIEAEAAPGFVFVGFTGSTASSQNPTDVTMDRDLQIEAIFQKTHLTLYVDDDALEDPGPANRFFSDPREDGSAEHPFDSIQEAIDIATGGLEIIVRSGVYYETLDLRGKSIHLNGYDPNQTDWPVVDAGRAGPVMRFTTHEDPNCRVTGLSLRGGWDDLAGAILCMNSAPTLERCLIAGNRASSPLGAAVHATDSFPSFENCTIADNVGAAGLRLVRSQVIIANTLLWNNGPTDLHVTDGQPPKVSYSLLKSFWPGPGNLIADPLFVRSGLWLNPGDANPQLQPAHPEATWLPGDYHPRSTTGRWHTQGQTWWVDLQHSPAIDAGDPNSDLALEQPPHADRINMGVYGGTPAASKSVAPLPTGSVGGDEPVSFADENLKACVEDALATFDPTPSDLLQLTGLNCRHAGIEDLTGLEYATNLDTLTLSFNAIESISPLAGLTNLESLTLNDNQISSISALDGLEKLFDLDVHNNQIQSVSALSGMTNLELLVLRGNQITSISPLSGLILLTSLELEENEISSISALSSLENLILVDLRENDISSISPLTSLTRLQGVDLRGNVLNAQAYSDHIQTILDNNPGVSLRYDPQP